MSQHPYKTRNSLNRQKRRHDIADTIDDIPFRPPHQKNKTNEFSSPSSSTHSSSSNKKMPIFSSTATQLNQERQKRSVWDEQKRSVWPQPNQPTPKQTSTLFKPAETAVAYEPVFRMSDDESVESPKTQPIYQIDGPTNTTISADYQPSGFQPPSPFQPTNFQNSHQISQSSYPTSGYQPTPFDQTAFEPTSFQQTPYEQAPSMIFQKPKPVFQKPDSPVSAFQKPYQMPSSNKSFLQKSSPRFSTTPKSTNISPSNSTSPKFTQKSTSKPIPKPTPKPTPNSTRKPPPPPLYRPVKEPFHEASAYQCLIQLEQELSQECDKYNPTDNQHSAVQQQLDLKDVSYMKFTEVGKELFEQNKTPRPFTKRRRDKSSSFSMPEVYTEVNDKDYEEIDGMLDMLDSGGDKMAIQSGNGGESERQQKSERNQANTQKSHRKRNSAERNIETDNTQHQINTQINSEKLTESGYKTTTPNNFSTAYDEQYHDQQYYQVEDQANFQNNFENPHNYPNTHVQDSMLGTSISESDMGISSQNIDISSQDGGIPDFNSTRPPSESEVVLDFDGGAMNFADSNADSNGNIHTYENNTPESMNGNSRELNSSESISLNGVTKPDNKHHKPPTQQFVQEGHVLKLCSTPTKPAKQSNSYGFVDPSDVYPENRPRSSNSRPESTENTKFNFTIRNTEDDYRKARYVKLVERRSQVQSACENHRIMIQSLENLLNQQRAKLAHDEQTMRVLDNELSKIQDE